MEDLGGPLGRIVAGSQKKREFAHLTKTKGESLLFALRGSLGVLLQPDWGVLAVPWAVLKILKIRLFLLYFEILEILLGSLGASGWSLGQPWGPLGGYLETILA